MGDLVARVRIPARWGELHLLAARLILLSPPGILGFLLGRAGHDRRAFAWVVVARPKHKAMVRGIVLVLPLLGYGRALHAWQLYTSSFPSRAPPCALPCRRPAAPHERVMSGAGNPTKGSRWSTLALSPVPDLESLPSIGGLAQVPADAPILT